MFQQSQLYLQKQLKAYFLNRDLLSPHLQIISLLVQIVLYISLINGSPFLNMIFLSYVRNNSNFMIIIFILFLIRWIFSVSFISFFYILILNCLLQSKMEILSVILFFLLTILISIDITSKISFDCIPSNISSQRLNLVKILHYVFLTFGVIITNQYSGFYLIQLSLIILASGLLFCQNISLMNNTNYKQCLIRCYIWIILEHLKIFLMTWTDMNIPFVQMLGPPLISQCLYEIYKYKKRLIKLDEFYIAEDYLSMSVELLRYIHSHEYNQQMQNQISAIIENQNNSNYKNKDKQYIKKVIFLLNKKISFFSQILLAELYISETGQLIKSKRIVENLKNQCKCYEIIHCILIYRLQQKINERYKTQMIMIHFAHYNQYFLSQQLKALLLKSSIKQIQFHQYKQKLEVEASELRRRANNLAKLQMQSHQKYNSFNIKCLYISMLYISYLFQVVRDYKSGYQILDLLNFQKQAAIDLDMEQKIFIRLSLLPELLSIQKIGQNVNNLLGYSRKELKYQNLQVLIPEFFRKHHRQLANELINIKFQESYMFKKKTLIKNNYGFYQQCDVLLFLDHNIEGQLSLVGYLHIRKDRAYDFQTFLFVQENGDILECSNNLNEFSPTINRMHSFQEYVEDYIDLNRPQIHKDKNSQLEYHPLRQMIFDKGKVYFFAEVINSNQSNIYDLSVTNHTFKTKVMTQKYLDSITPLDYPQQVLVKYAHDMKQIVKKLYNKSFVSLIVIIPILILGMFLSQYYLLQGVKTKTNHLNLLDTINGHMKDFYNCTYKLAIDMNYRDLHMQYNYSNQYTQLGLLQEALILQGANQYLKIFNNVSHHEPSLVPGLSYQKTHYQLIQQFISNSYLTYQFQDDSYQFQHALNRSRLNMQTIFISSILDYRFGFLSLTNDLSQQDHQINIISLIFFFIISFLLFPVICRLQSQFRSNNDEVMALIYSIHPSQQQIQGIKKYISKLTTEQIDFKSPEFLIIIKKESQLAQREQSNTQLSLRQFSGRNLINDSLNKSQFHAQQANLKERQSFPAPSENLRISSRNKFMLLIPFLIIFVMWTLALTNQLFNNMYRDIDELQTTNTIVSLNRLSSGFSKGINNMLNFICLKSSGQVNFNTTAFTSYINSYMASATTTVFPVIEQTSYPEFATFTVALNQFKNQYICTFTNCAPEYQGEINLLYYGVIQQISNFLPTMLSALNNITSNSYNGGLLFINTHKYQIDLMFYTEDIMRNLVSSLCSIYSSCFSVFISAVTTSKLLFMYSIVILTGISSILFCWLTAYIIKNQRELQRICQLIKIDEKILPDEQE